MRTLLCYGDSNTHGTVPLPAGGARARYGPEVRWPRLLGRRLGEGWLVIEEGLPGRTAASDDPLARANRNGHATLTAILESHRPLDAVALMLGTNDLKRRFSLTASDVGRAIERLGRTIVDTSWDHASGVEGRAPHLLVVAPPPLPEDGPFAAEEPGAAETSRAVTEAIRAAAGRMGVDFLDAGEVTAFSPLDGVHLDEGGHAALARAIAARIERIG